METVTRLWSRDDGWDKPLSSHRSPDFSADLILVFWDSAIDPAEALAGMRTQSPDALIVGCSTPEHIVDGVVSDADLVATEISFGHAMVRGFSSQLEYSPSRDLGRELAKQLLNDQDEAPRAVLTRILGKAPAEFADRRDKGACSGGGGLLPKTMPVTSKKIASARKKAHDAQGGGRIVTACASSLRSFRKAGAEADDIATWIAKAIR